VRWAVLALLVACASSPTYSDWPRADARAGIFFRGVFGQEGFVAVLYDDGTVIRSRGGGYWVGKLRDRDRALYLRTLLGVCEHELDCVDPRDLVEGEWRVADSVGCALPLSRLRRSESFEQPGQRRPYKNTVLLGAGTARIDHALDDPCTAT